MNTAYDIVAAFVAKHAIAWDEFNAWFEDCGYPQEEANSQDSRYLEHLQEYVEERYDHS